MTARVSRSLHSVVVCLALLSLSGCSMLRPSNTVSSFHGFKSEEQLLDEFLAALTAADQPAMDRLRVTKSEYRNVIIPGSVPLGKTMSGPLTDSKFNYFWSMLNTRSRDFGFVILKDFGGSHWHRKRYWYTKEPVQLSGYRALGQVRIAVEDGEGNQGTVRTGWIAEVAGQYKFIGFEYDD